MIIACYIVWILTSYLHLNLLRWNITLKVFLFNNLWTSRIGSEVSWKHSSGIPASRYCSWYVSSIFDKKYWTWKSWRVFQTFGRVFPRDFQSFLLNGDHKARMIELISEQIDTHKAKVFNILRSNKIWFHWAANAFVNINWRTLNKQPRGSWHLGNFT